MKITRFLFLCLVTSTLLGGCATTENERKLHFANMEEMLGQASAASNSQQPEKALSILKTATGAFPSEKAAWLQIAQMQFEIANYSEAIINAQEVLQRDPQNKHASSIIAVSGLRLSNKALADLSRQNNLSGSLKTEAQDLAKLLRETLGEPVLVPVRARAVAPPFSAVQANKKNARSKASHVAASKPDDGGNANPFGALK